MASKRKYSPLWDHFESTEPKKAKCNYCSKTLAMSSSSIGSLSRHMKKVHPTINIKLNRLERIDDHEENASSTDLDQNVQEVPTTSTATSTSTAPIATTSTATTSTKATTVRRSTQIASTSMKDYIEIKKPLSLIKSQQLDEQLLKMIAKGYHALRIVEEQEFRKLVEMLNPGYKLPTRKTLSESLLPKAYNKALERVKKEIVKAIAVCITTDGWRSVTNDDYIAITAHYIDPDTYKLCSVMIGCCNYNESHTMVNISEFLHEKFCEWNIDYKITAVVSDNAANILGAVRIGGWRSVSCFAHSINLLVQNSLTTISETVTKVKNVVEYFNRSLPGARKLKEIQEQMNIAPLKLKQDISTRWNSTFDMLNRFFKIKDAIIATIAIIRSDLALSPNDWIVVEKAIPILSIFYEVTNEVSGENYVSASKYIVFCKLMSNQIEKFSAETTEPIKAFVTRLKDEMMQRFGDVEKNVLLREATILDPRFKQRGFRDIKNFDTAAAELKSKIGRIILPSERSNIPEPAEPSTVPSKANSIWEQFDEEVARLVPENPVAA
ncbi:jg25847, partial [Pararge aegeria aegeria]